MCVRPSALILYVEENDISPRSPERTTVVLKKAIRLCLRDDHKWRSINPRFAEWPHLYSRYRTSMTLLVSNQGGSRNTISLVIQIWYSPTSPHCPSEVTDQKSSSTNLSKPRAASCLQKPNNSSYLNQLIRAGLQTGSCSKESTQYCGNIFAEQKMAWKKKAHCRVKKKNVRSISLRRRSAHGFLSSLLARSSLTIDVLLKNGNRRYFVTWRMWKTK